MSSGLGLKGNVSRCYQYFEDFAVCMKKEADGGNQITCKPKRDDYLECLHHKKEKLRADAISAEAARQAAGGGSNGHGSHGGH